MFTYNLCSSSSSFVLNFGTIWSVLTAKHSGPVIEVHEVVYTIHLSWRELHARATCTMYMYAVAHSNWLSHFNTFNANHIHTNTAAMRIITCSVVPHCHDWSLGWPDNWGRASQESRQITKRNRHSWFWVSLLLFRFLWIDPLNCQKYHVYTEC